MSDELVGEERPQHMTGNLEHILGPEERAAIHFWETWGRSAYKSIKNNVPCEPPTDVVIHVHGEQVPMHRFLLDQFFEKPSTWPTLDGYNLECPIPANHFRALHQLAYTGATKLFMDYMFRELCDYVRLVRRPSGGCDVILDMDVEIPDARLLLVARHILEFRTVLKKAGCGKMRNGAAEEAMGIIGRCWIALFPFVEVTLERILVWHDEILRDWQKWTDEITLSHEISRLDISFDWQARI